ncbi:winged helix-turn-helix domain-containing protein [Ignisphaera sp. 4213-co]|uniref:Winged helix-turn-helix domain-containing protein n=1 Tax=Ignisphaera cupida TaxID=3050454 RepID=A0ABD4Z5C6_9CREN|nr:winged helix-turn-helix domain-containing protein [Ignisphaera sp. 4213-co]MDK6028172.1 winged helix-turn-helix domain-containing protein [Ignisphaera sp. 4213-co]
MAKTKRSRIEIVYEILKTLSQEELLPTRLAMFVNVPYDRLSDIINILKKKKLVEEVEVENN